jgi:hypothetical protein
MGIDMNREVKNIFMQLSCRLSIGTGPRWNPARLACVGVAVLVLSGCAAHRTSRARAVSIDARRTPVADTTHMSARPVTREWLLQQAVRDTVAAGARLRRCAGRKLLPEQESLWDSTARLLVEARVALERGDATRARSLARDARQLSTSLDCH